MSEAGERPKKRMGRPPKAPEKGRRQNYTFRMSDSTRDQIIDAASKSGRSVSEEIERRVETSFKSSQTDAFVSAMLGGSMVATIAKDLAIATKHIDPPSGANSYEPYRRALLKAAERILAFHLPDQRPFAPPTERTPAWEASCARAEMFGDMIGGMVIESAWDALVEKAAREQVDLPPSSEEELAAFVDSPGLMGTWARDEIRKRKENG